METNQIMLALQEMMKKRLKGYLNGSKMVYNILKLYALSYT
jgi:hypothetical protein